MRDELGELRHPRGDEARTVSTQPTEFLECTNASVDRRPLVDREWAEEIDTRAAFVVPCCSGFHHSSSAGLPAATAS